MQLMNYPSGDEEFDKWFRETQPDWAAQIDAQIAKDELFNELLGVLDYLIEMHDEEPPMLSADDWQHAREVLAKAKGLS